MPYRKRYGSIEAIAKKTNSRCHLCHEKIDPRDYGSTSWLGGDAVNVDHLLPQSFGGGDELGNLMLAHARCNSIRGTRDEEVVRMQLAGTRRAPRSSGQVTADMSIGALGLGFGAGLVFARPGESFNKGAAVLGGLVGMMLLADW